MNLLELNFDIQGKIGQEISKIRKLEKIEQEQKQNKSVSSKQKLFHDHYFLKFFQSY